MNHETISPRWAEEKKQPKKVVFNSMDFFKDIDVSNLPKGYTEVIPYAQIDYNSFFRAFKFAFNKINKKEFLNHSYGSDSDYVPKEVVKTLTYYFFRDPKFYQSKLLSDFTEASLKKGLILVSVKGIGKTDIMKAFNELFSNADKYEVRNINNKVVKLDVYNFLIVQFFYGRDLIKLIKEEKTTPNLAIRPIYIDDLMRESEVNNYGNKINLKDFLLERYENRAITLASMNYIKNENPLDIYNSFKEKYGSPLDDRFYEMFNIIEIKGVKSFRR